MKFKVLGVVLASFLIAACQPEAEVLNYPVLPDGLKDCEFYRVSRGEGDRMIVVRCPESTTTVAYKAGKANRRSVTID